MSAARTAGLRPKSVNASTRAGETSDKAWPATGFVVCKVTFLYGEDRRCRWQLGLRGAGRRAGAPEDFSGRQSVAAGSHARYEGSARGLLVGKLRCARPPFVVSEISDSKAASSKPDARAKTGATARSEAHSDRFPWQRKQMATV